MALRDVSRAPGDRPISSSRKPERLLHEPSQPVPGQQRGARAHPRVGTLRRGVLPRRHPDVAASGNDPATPLLPARRPRGPGPVAEVLDQGLPRPLPRRAPAGHQPARPLPARRAGRGPLAEPAGATTSRWSRSRASSTRTTTATSAPTSPTTMSPRRALPPARRQGGLRPERAVLDREATCGMYPDVVEIGLNPLLHYLRHGRHRGPAHPSRAAPLRPYVRRAVRRAAGRASAVPRRPRSAALGPPGHRAHRQRRRRRSLFGGVGTALILGVQLANRLGGAPCASRPAHEPPDAGVLCPLQEATGVRLDGTSRRAPPDRRLASRC